MKNLFIKTVGCIALLSIFFLQGIWLFEVYDLTDKEVRSSIDSVFSKSIESEIFFRNETRPNVIPRGQAVEGIQPQNTSFENALIYNKYLNSYFIYFNPTIFDSICKKEIETSIGNIEFIAHRYDSTGKVLNTFGNELVANNKFVYSSKLPTIPDNSEYIQYTISNPFILVFNKIVWQTLMSFLVCLIIGYCIYVQIRAISRQRKIDKIQKEFSESVINDLQTPITKIKDNALLLDKDTDKQTLAVVERGTKQLLNLVNKTLLIAKKEHENIDRQQQELSLFKSKPLKFITTVSLILILVLQAIWVQNAYSILEKKFTSNIEETLEKALTQHYILRLKKYSNIITEGTSIHGNLSDSPHEFIIAFNEKMDTLQVPFDFVLLDSIFKSDYKKTLSEDIKYKMSMLDSSGNIIDSGSNLPLNVPTLIIKLPVLKNNKMVAKLEVTSPYKIIVQQLFAILFISGILVLFFVFSTILQLRAIVRQNNIAATRQQTTYTSVHDMKTPIASIMGATAALLGDQLNNKPDMKLRFTEIVQDSGIHLQTQLDKIIRIIKVARTKIEINKQRFDIKAMIDSIIAQTSVRANKTIRFSTEYKNAELLYADPELLKDALFNLIDNSLKYSNTEVHISIKCICNKQNTIISIKDNGIGISESDLQKIFNKFERGSISDNHSGFGLGLSYVYLIAEAHNGSISVDSKQSEFTEIKITIPNKRRWL